MKTIFYVILINILPHTVFCSGNSAHEKIIQWWNEMSEQKPLKCTLNELYLKPFHEFGQTIIGALKSNL